MDNNGDGIMEITITEKLNMAMIKGGKAYDEWNKLNDIPDYLSVIFYELLMRKKVTQRQLVELTDLPKQSINKGIKILQNKGYLVMTIDKHDKRKKFCELTPSGKVYAKEKMQSLFELEEKTAQKMGMKKMKQFLALNEEWNDIFWNLLKEKEGDKRG